MICMAIMPLNEDYLIRWMIVNGEEFILYAIFTSTFIEYSVTV